MTSALFPTQVKFTLAPPADSDPPTNPYWTRDQMIGIHPPVINLADLPTPATYGAIGNGAADDTNAYQRWLDAIAGRAGYGAPGTYLVSRDMRVNGATTIYGSGRSTHVLKKAPGFPNVELLRNAHFPEQAGAFGDADIAIFGMCLDGSGITSVKPLASFVGVMGLTWRDCLFTASHWMCIAITGSINIIIDTNRFVGWGRRESEHTELAGSGVRQGGAAIWMAALSGWARPADVVIRNNTFLDGNWGGIQVDADRILISGNDFKNLQEFGIAARLVRGGRIADNKVYEVHVNDIIGHGITVAGQGVSVVDNTTVNVGQSGIDASILQDSVVEANICINSNRDRAWPNQGAAIALLNYPGFDYEMARIVVASNVVTDLTQPSGYGIVLSSQAPPATALAPPMHDVYVMGNMLGDTAWAEAPIGINPDNSILGERVVIQGNSGSNTNLGQTTVRFGFPIGTSGTKHIGGVGFKSSRIELEAAVTTNGWMGSSVGRAGRVVKWDVPTQAAVSLEELGNLSLNVAGKTANQRSNVTDLYSIFLQYPDGSYICSASVTNVDDDGFDLTFTAPTTEDVYVAAACYS